MIRRRPRVPSWGRLDARLVIVAEAPGRFEVERGMPLVGPSGRLLADWWHEVGLKRADFYLMNCCEYQAPGSHIKNLPREEVEAWASTVHARLSVLKDPWLIVPLGEIALRALLEQPLWSPKSMKIGNLRGSILSCTLNRRTVKVIPSYHPAATFKDPSLARICRMDWARIAGDAKFRELRLPERTHHIPPIDPAWLDDYLDVSHSRNEVMAIDIETVPRERRITCVGFSYDPAHSLTLPWPKYRKEIKALCESACQKVLQNGNYDAVWLAGESITVRNYQWDTLSMSHCLCSVLPHDLASMASLWTRSVYWKSERKDADDPRAGATYDRSTLYRYNGKDACVTRELFDVFYQRLKEAA